MAQKSSKKDEASAKSTKLSSKNVVDSDADSTESGSDSSPAPAPKKTKKNLDKDTPLKKPTTKAVSTKATPRATPAKKTKTSSDLKPLPFVGDEVARISVSYDSDLSARILKSGIFSHTLTLESSATFSLVSTHVATSGPDKGCQVIVMRPANAFPFMKLPIEVRSMVYKTYFANKGVINAPITIEGKRKGTNDPYAKQFSGGDKNRVALLSVSKTINTEACPYIYGLPLRFDCPASLLNFLGLLGEHQKAQLREIHVVKISKAPSNRSAFNFLASSAYNLQRLRLEEDVTKEGNVEKAVKAFWAEMQRFFETFSNTLIAHGTAASRSEVMDILDFGPKALLAKDTPYDDERVEAFKEALKAKFT